jgi:enolase
MTKITKIKAREILDSRGNPTVEAEVYTKNNFARASVPSGASTGAHEEVELRDHTKRFLGLGVQKAVRNINKKIAPLLKGKECTKQKVIDILMIRKDGTEDKEKLGANAILAVSLACAKLAAKESKLPLYKYIAKLTKSKPKLPRPFFNIINGGKHADTKLSFQEFMISPRFKEYKKNLQVASEIYHTLKKDLHKKYGKGSTNVGDEGGFAPKVNKTEDALKILMKAIKDAGYQNKIDLAMDCAASEFYKNKRYLLDGKKLTKEALTKYYLKLIKKYPFISIEDPFNEEDFISFANLTKLTKVQIVGDDLTVTNIERIEAAVKEKSCNCLLLKVNQIGTLTEALEAVQLARSNGWKVMVSHRSGETEETFIADLAVGIGAAQIKAGAPCRGERTAKYNQLLRIAESFK